jgi:hypothetical protein
MKIKWNKVTWYSKGLAVLLFVGTFFLGYLLGSERIEKVYVPFPYPVKAHENTGDKLGNDSGLQFTVPSGWSASTTEDKATFILRPNGEDLCTKSGCATLRISVYPNPRQFPIQDFVKEVLKHDYFANDNETSEIEVAGLEAFEMLDPQHVGGPAKVLLIPWGARVVVVTDEVGDENAYRDLIGSMVLPSRS